MRILFLTNLSPWPVHGGGSQRSNLVCQALQSLGEVDLVLAGRGGESTEGLHEHFKVAAQTTWREPGQRWPFQTLHRYRSRLGNEAALALLPKRAEYQPDPNAASVVRRLLREKPYDLVVGRYLRATMKSGCMDWGGPTILDLDDVDSHVYRSRLNDPRLPRLKRWISQHHYHQAEALQRELLPRFDAVWVANDRVEGLDYLPGKIWLPNIPFPRGDASAAGPLPEPPPDAPPALVFVGSLGVYPNVSAVDHFVRAIWPAVHAAEPRARFRIAGPGLSPGDQARWSAVPGVETLGFVENLADVYAGAHFAVAPILAGSGTNIKVIECFAYGRTCVVSSFAAAPFAGTLRDGEALRVGGTDQAFSAACIDLLRDAPQRASLVSRGREAVRQHFSFDAFQSVVADTVSRVMAKARP